MIYQPKPGADYTAPTITIDNNPLKVTDKFTYLGSTISQNALIDDEISARIGKASGSFGKLTKRLWSERGVRLVTKSNVYCAVVLPTLLYGCEAWTPYRRHIRRLDQFHMRCLRRIANIKWQDMIPNTEVLQRCAQTGIEQHIKRVRLRWSGHLVRMARPMTASPRTCSTENWTLVIEHGEDNESGIRTCLRQRWSHAAFPTTPGKPLRQTVPSGVVPAIPVYETTKRRGATPRGIREWDGRLSSLHQTLTHFYVMSAADSAHHGSACIATTEHMPTQTLTEVQIRRTDGSLYIPKTYCLGWIYLPYLALSTALYILLSTNLPRADTCNKPHKLRDAVTGRNRKKSASADPLKWSAFIISACWWVLFAKLES